MPLITIVSGTVKLSEWSSYSLIECLKELDEKKITIESGFIYAVSGVEESDGYLFGRLRKLSRKRSQKYFDIDTWEEKTEYIESPNLYGEYSESRFIISDNGLIALEDKHSLLRPSQFKSMLEELIRQVAEATVNLVIGFKTDVVELSQFIEKADTINRIEFKRMRTSNPIKLKGIENIESLIKAGVGELSVNHGEGKSIDPEETTISGGLELTKKGYADAKIDANVSGRKKSFSSRTKIMRSKTPIDDDDEFINEAKNLLE